MSSSRTQSPPHTRRRHPRYDIVGAFQFRDRTLDTVVDVVDVSLGGFCSSSTVAPAPGALHEFEVTVGSSEVLVLKAREVYGYPLERQAGRYAVGWTWANMPAAAQGAPAAVVALLDYLASAESGVDLIEQPADELPDDR